MTNASKSRKRCPACGSSNPADAWECEMCGTSFGDVKPPKSIQKAEASPRATAPAAQPAAQSKPAPAKPAANGATRPPTAPATKPAGKTASKPPTAATMAAAATAKAATETVNTPIKNAGSIKRPKPLYASQPRFGLGSLVGLIFVAAFAIAAIVFGLNTLSGNTPAAAPAQPAFTLDVTATTLPAVIETIEITETSVAAEATPAIAPTDAPTDAPIEVPAVVNTEAPASTAEVAATTTPEPAVAPSPTPAAQPTATTQPTATAAASPTPAPTTAPASAGSDVTYTVKGGDTCGKIAKQFGITVAEIVQWNNLDDRCFLNVNKVLTIKK